MSADDDAQTPCEPPPPATTYHLAVDGAGVVRGKVRSNAEQPDMVSVDRPTYNAAAVATTQLVAGPPAADGSTPYTVEPYAPPAPPPPPRRASLVELLDSLSPAQRAALQATDAARDQWMRLQAEATASPDGKVWVGCSKVVRSAGDLGMAPGDWFKLAGI